MIKFCRNNLLFFFSFIGSLLCDIGIVLLYFRCHYRCVLEKTNQINLYGFYKSDVITLLENDILYHIDCIFLVILILLSLTFVFCCLYDAFVKHST